jgi:hypothetical protein
MKGGYDRVKMSGKIVKGNHDAVVKGNQAAVQRRQRGAQKAEFDYEKYKNDPRILDRFAAWYVRSAREGSLPIKMFFDNVAFFNKGGVGDEGTEFLETAAITLYRQEQLQVQLILSPANSVVPKHNHPNVDSYETFIGGPVHLETDQLGDGTMVLATPKESIFALEDGTCSVFLRSVKVPSSMTHGGPVGDSPAAFLTIQHWKNGVKPTFVHLDWAEDGAETV